MFGWLDALCGDELDCDRIRTDAVPPLVCAECISPFGGCYKLGFSLKLFLLAERSGPVCGLCGHNTFSTVVRFLGACSRNQAKEFEKFWNILELENHVIFARLTLWRVMTVFLQVSTMAASPRDPVAVAIVIVAITIFCDSRFCLPMEARGVKLLSPGEGFWRGNSAQQVVRPQAALLDGLAAQSYMCSRRIGGSCDSLVGGRFHPCLSLAFHQFSAFFLSDIRHTSQTDLHYRALPLSTTSNPNPVSVTHSYAYPF